MAILEHHRKSYNDLLRKSSYDLLRKSSYDLLRKSSNANENDLNSVEDIYSINESNGDYDINNRQYDNLFEDQEIEGNNADLVNNEENSKNECMSDFWLLQR